MRKARGENFSMSLWWVVLGHNTLIAPIPETHATLGSIFTTDGGVAMVETPDILETGEVARLIPVIADSRKEQRVTSVFLATLSAVPDFARVLLASIGQRLGKRSVLDTYTEVVLKDRSPQSNDRPDGLVLLAAGSKSWGALVEAKIGSSALDGEQVERYLQLARANGLDAVITISNQFATTPNHSPVKVSKTLTRKVSLCHWSWKFVLTEAILLQTQSVVTDPDQAFILREFIRFLSHDSVGISGFESMPPDWKPVVLQVKSGVSLKQSAPEIQTVVAAWHQETKDVALRISRHLAVSVVIRLSRSHASNPDERFKAACEELAVQNKLSAEFDIPNAASSLEVVADLRRQTIRVGMQLDAPQDRKTCSARVNWLLNQLKKAEGGGVYIRIIWPSRAADTFCSLVELREDAKAAVSGSPQPPRAFEVFFVTGDTRRFSGRKTFIEELETAIPHFYDSVGQHLEKWRPKPPKPVKDKDEAEPVERGDPPSERPTPKLEEVRNAIRESVATPGNKHSSLMDIPDFLRKFGG